MAQKKIFLHIGNHKTATSTIQLGCCINRKALKEAGWLYPETGIFLNAHHNIVWEKSPGYPHTWNQAKYWTNFVPRLGGMRELLIEIEGSSAQNIIISAESFNQFSPVYIEKLKKDFKDYQVKVIIYLREQSLFLQSLWSQYVKSGLTTDDFHIFINQILLSEDDVVRYFGAYDLLLKPWINVFEKRHVHPIPFVLGTFRKNAFLTFLAHCNVPNTEQFQTPENQNISPGFKTLEIIRLINQDIVSVKKRNIIGHYVRRIAKENQWDKQKLNLLDLELYERIQSRFTSANQYLSENFCDGRPFFGTKFEEKTLSSFDKRSMSRAEWEKIARSMVIFFAEEYM